MNESVRASLRDSVQGLIDSGLSTSFTAGDLRAWGVKIKPLSLTPKQIRAVRLKRGLSQAVFARLLSVSPSAVRQWEQGVRKPTGAAQVLLEIVKRQPNVLDYRMTVRQDH